MRFSVRLNSHCSGLALALSLAAAPAAAQTTPAAPDAQPAPAAAPAPADPAGEIVVTGTSIRGVAPVGSALVSLGSQDIAASGRVTLDRAIRELPQVFDLGVSENSRGQSGGAGNIVYGNSINLRGIGPNATLILIDGHRVTNNSRSTDPSVLPTLGVERVEIIADGASAIYGSDAVAGVVNLIPRRTLNGAEAFGRYGVSDDGVYHELALGAAVGKRFGRGQVMVAFEHVEKTNLNSLDRGFFRSDQTAFGGKNYSVMRCNPGTIRITSGTTTLNSYRIPDGGLTQANAGSLVSGSFAQCDDLLGQDLIPKQSYNSVNATFTFELTDWLSFFADGFYSKRKFERLPAFANGSLVVPSTNAFFVRPAGFTGASYTIDYNYRYDWVRNKSFGFGESWQVTPGLRAKLPYDWQIEGIVAKGRTSDNSSSLNGIGTTALNAALASSNPLTAFDPYGLGRTQPAVLQGIFNQISINPTIGHFLGYRARANGPLFNLPGGAVKLAFGYEAQ